jgi:alanine-glyoxylate transaminase/serine-glyoxylate transaminase/serine-pyruvate transaminase
VQALIAPLTGHRDPSFLSVLEDTASLLRQVFGTTNRATFALPATGGSSMEASLINLLEPGDTVVIGDAGFFAHRMVDICARLESVETVTVGARWGRPVDNDALIEAVKTHRPKVLAVVHGETSTGVEQPFEGLADVCREVGTYLVVDAVATVGGVRLEVDDLGIDVCYAGSQKCLSAPPGLAPVTVSDRAMNAIAKRRTPVQSWYFDFGLHARLWGPEHNYHHTSPVLNVYALREALRLVVEEGIQQRLERHRLHAAALRAGLGAMGLCQLAEPAFRVPSVTTALAPPGISAAAIRRVLLDEYNIEIAAGLGEYADRMWRIGIMGHSAQRANVLLVLAALERVLARAGFAATNGAALEADAVYTAAER